MGSSSTKRKPSSVNKKKRLSRKSSSQVRKRKRDRSRTKKEKSRKVLRHEDSDSYSGSDSRSPSTSFSSEDSYSRKRSRSCTRKGGKESRKRARRSPSCGTSLDLLRVKKRKVSKRKPDLDSRKESIKKKKKKSKRDLSPSSASQSSCSCLVCCGGASSCSEGEYEKKRGGRSDRKYRYEDVKKDRSGTRQSRPAHSRQTEDSGYYSKEKSMGEDYPKRLRSVITVFKAPDQVEVSESVKDKRTDYLVYDHDDYPSDRSNGSSECRNKMQFGHHSLVTSEATSKVKDANDKDAFISNDRTFMLPGCDDEDKYDGRATWIGVKAKNQVYEGEVSAGTVNPEAEDLESVLRQRALENLLKFRGGIPKKAGQNEKSDSNAQPTSGAKSVSIRVNTGKEDGNEVTSDTQLIDQAVPPAVSCTQLHIGQDTDPMEHSSIRSAAPELVKTKDRKKAGIETVQSTRINATSLGSDSQGAGTDSTPVAVNVCSKPVRLALTADPKQKAGESSGVKPSTLSSKREPIGMFAPVKQILTLNASHNSKSLVAKGELDKSTAGTGSLTPESGNKLDEVDLSAANDAVAPHASSPEPAASAEASSGDLQGETKDSSQYEQKTMSVMRGGEMVQVNYKVYIPKKASALARRQLKR